MNKTAAVVCASGIGDALIFHMLSYHLHTVLGMQVTTFSDPFPSFGGWLPSGFSFAPQPRTPEEFAQLCRYDAVFLQYDNSPKALAIRALRPRCNLHLLYGSYRAEKHGPLHSNDRILQENLTVADALCLSMNCSKENGFAPPPGLIHRRYPNRVAIHPLSQDPTQRWSKKRFLDLFQQLKAEGFDPFFLTSPSESADWGAVITPTLEAAAAQIYESGYFIGNNSGPSHLASLLRIPSLIISKGEKQWQKWAPSWLPPTPISPRFVPNFKGMRWRENRWQYFISTKRVLNTFRNITKQDNI